MELPRFLLDNLISIHRLRRLFTRLWDQLNQGFKRVFELSNKISVKNG
jgi:hypothetical protein